MGFELFKDFLKMNPIDETVLIKIPAGEFLAGGGGERSTESVFPVFLPEYYIALHPVTNAQYKKFIKMTNHREPFYDYWQNPELSDHPVLGVDWNDAQKYCEWSGLRLPYELEWEKAARGLDGRKYSSGNEFDEFLYRHYRSAGTEKTSSVWNYAKGCSPFGLYQSAGNVWEWCSDYWEENAYKRYEQKDLTPPEESNRRLMRGGSCHISYEYIRVAMRFKNNPINRNGLTGFRLAKGG